MGGTVILSDKSYKKPRGYIQERPTLQATRTAPVGKKPVKMYIAGQPCFGGLMFLFYHKHYIVYPITPE